MSEISSRRSTLQPQPLRALLCAAGFFLFPSVCFSCGARVTRWLRGGVCEACWETLPAPASAACEICDESLPAAEAARCGRCLLDPPAFRALKAAAPYRGSARRILIAFKFRGADYLAGHLARVMSDRLGPRQRPSEVVAVPATQRARRRGDHAAELLARALAARLEAPWAPRRLEKIRENRKQSSLPLAQRPSNVRAAFRVRGKPPSGVLLVDDVATSGATARECARVLAGAGAATVDVWCFARASREDLLMDEPRVEWTGLPSTLNR